MGNISDLYEDVGSILGFIVMAFLLVIIFGLKVMIIGSLIIVGIWFLYKENKNKKYTKRRSKSKRRKSRRRPSKRRKKK